MHYLPNGYFIAVFVFKHHIHDNYKQITIYATYARLFLTCSYSELFLHAFIPCDIF